MRCSGNTGCGAPMKILTLQIIFLLAVLFSCRALPGQTAPWIGGHAVSPSVTYQYRVEQKTGFHQQIHRLDVDLLSPDVSLELIPARDFALRGEYPAEILKRTGAVAVAPAALFRGPEGGRYYPAGSLGFSGTLYSRTSGYPEMVLRPLNQCFFRENPVSDEVPALLELEEGAVMPLAGLNTAPAGPGYYFLSSMFGPITRKDWDAWKLRNVRLLAPLSGDVPPGTFRVDRLENKARDLQPSPGQAILLFRGEEAEATPAGLARGRHARLIPSGENERHDVKGIFTGGPWFLRGGRYDGEGVRRFCELPGTPPSAWYEEKKARLALAFDAAGTNASLFAVDQKGFAREGMTLKELADLLAAEGMMDAMCLPDGDMASLVLPLGRMNTTPAGVEMPVLTALCIMDRKPREGEFYNLLRRNASNIRTCGEAAGNPPEAICDGKYIQTPALNTWWEHEGGDNFHEHRLVIDLLGVYEVAAVDIYLAEEVGFSSHFNIRRLSLWAHESDAGNMSKIQEVANPEGLSVLNVNLPEGTKCRHFMITIEEPDVFGATGAVRIAELVLWGRK